MIENKEKMPDYDLHRFHKAQEHTFQKAFNEIGNGKKTSHWMWYIFPQLAGLGSSEMARHYAVSGLKEAELYLQNPILGERLISISKVLVEHKGKTAHEIFGSPDDMKLRSCMTLFSLVKDADPVFRQVLGQYFNGMKDPKTLELLQRSG